MILNGFDVPAESKHVACDGNGAMHWYNYKPMHSIILGAYVKKGPYGIRWGRAKTARLKKVRTK